jgi:hypothetical protein
MEKPEKNCMQASGYITNLSAMAKLKSAYRVLLLGIILSLIYSRIFSFTLIAAFEGFVLAIFLAWFISKVDLKPGSAFISSGLANSGLKTDRQCSSRNKPGT